jgi:xanthine dehydrogenase YagT iron-sulfur-binding subunit
MGECEGTKEEFMREKKEKKSQAGPGITRRGFLQLMGAGAVASAATQGVGAESATGDIGLAQMTKIKLLVNGRSHDLLVEPRWSLLFVLREKLGLTGTKVGCERGECGACTVLIESEPRYACMTLAVEAVGKEIITIEGLMRGEELGPVQQAFLEHDAFQCGYCTPGQIMSVEGLLRSNPNPSPEEIRLAVSGNLCRCGSYDHIFKAARRAAELRKG